MGFPAAKTKAHACHPGKLRFSIDKPIWKGKMLPSPKVLKKEKQQTQGSEMIGEGAVPYWTWILGKLLSVLLVN